MVKFTELALGEPLLRAIADEGYTSPTPIQQKVIPAMLDGRDIVGIAQTGTGKTASFVLPLLQQHQDSHGGIGPKKCRALILVPTRELAAQVGQSIQTYGKYIGHSVAIVVGGVKPGPQVKALSKGVDIIVATPGRLEDHLSTGKVRLDRTRTVILDEADQMLDLGFMPAIRRLMKQLPMQRQTLLLSATMPKQIRALASDFLDQPLEISVAPQSRPIERISQSIYFADKEQKRELLAKLLAGADVRRAIVFTRTKHGANKVVQYLEKAGIPAAAIHGNKSQSQRVKTLAAFKANQLNVLIATDIAARGIDIDDISHVFNFELPNVPETYVHRIGRTARAGKNGMAISFCDGSERKLLRDIEKLIKKSIPVSEDSGPPAPFEDAPIARHTAPRNRPPARKNKRGKSKPKNKQNFSKANAQGDGRTNSSTSGTSSEKTKPRTSKAGEPAKARPKRKRRPRRSN